MFKQNDTLHSVNTFVFLLFIYCVNTLPGDLIGNENENPFKNLLYRFLLTDVEKRILVTKNGTPSSYPKVVENEQILRKLSNIRYRVAFGKIFQNKRIS